MKLRLAIDFCLAEGQSLSKGVSMSDWAEERARSVKARLNREQGKIAGWIENRKLIEEQGPGLWRELRTHLESLVHELNRALGPNALLIVGKEPSEMDIRFTVHDPAHQLLVWFEATTAQDALRWTYPGGKGADQKCRLVPNAAGVLCFWSNGYTSNPETIAKSMLDGLLLEQ